MAPYLFQAMVKELCHRCSKPVYPTDKCYICGTRLALKTYCNNRNNIDDQEIYCNNHVPNANPHDPVPARPNGKQNGASRHHNNNGTLNTYHSGSSSTLESEQNGRGKKDAGLQDLRIAHAMKATQVAKPYPKIKHEGAKYVVDYDAQTRLELIHRTHEDQLYSKFMSSREQELHEFEEETKENGRRH
uniref:Uncharacterized protein n=1 Tax=Ditylenchus dipsaci TaxID=166011 RepID=A0A915CTT7_9BILA